jgi:hypothetical protein
MGCPVKICRIGEFISDQEGYTEWTGWRALESETPLQTDVRTVVPLKTSKAVFSHATDVCDGASGLLASLNTISLVHHKQSTSQSAHSSPIHPKDLIKFKNASLLCQHNHPDKIHPKAPVVRLITFQCYAENNHTSKMLPYKSPKWRRNNS